MHLCSLNNKINVIHVQIIILDIDDYSLTSLFSHIMECNVSLCVSTICHRLLQYMYNDFMGGGHMHTHAYVHCRKLKM